jgi:hypothetical protein
MASPLFSCRTAQVSRRIWAGYRDPAGASRGPDGGNGRGRGGLFYGFDYAGFYHGTPTERLVLHEIEASANVRTVLTQSGRTRVRPILMTAAAMSKADPSRQASKRSVTTGWSRVA